MFSRTKKYGLSGLLAGALFALPALAAADAFMISYPANNDVVSGSVITLEGTGAPSGSSIEVKVMTDQWYVQTGKADIRSDGEWTYGPCYLKGEGEYNNHTIKATVIKDGKTIDSATVRGVVRK